MLVLHLAADCLRPKRGLKMWIVLLRYNTSLSLVSAMNPNKSTLEYLGSTLEYLGSWHLQLAYNNFTVKYCEYLWILFHIYVYTVHTYIYIYIYISKCHMKLRTTRAPAAFFFAAKPMLSQCHLQSSGLLWVVTEWHAHSLRPVSPLVSYLGLPGWNLLSQVSPVP